MNKIRFFVAAAILCAWGLAAAEAGAAPIFSARTQIDIGSMTVQGGDGLTVNWGEPALQSFLSEGAGGWWLDENGFGVYSEVYPEDFSAWPYQGVTYGAHTYSGGTLHIPFTVEGSGFLTATSPYSAGYESPFPYPDAYGGGPDFYIAAMTLVRGETFSPDYSNRRFDWRQLDKPDFYEGVLWTVEPGPEPLYFADGDAGFLSLYAWSECSIWYDEIPVPAEGGAPAPVPEPATLLLLGGGLAGLAAKRRSMA